MSHPRHLVIGGRGLVGTALCKELFEQKIGFEFTSRKASDGITYDLATGNPKRLAREFPHPEVVYLVAAKTKFHECEGNPFAWIVNVDAPIGIMRFYSESFCIFVSSDAVEWAGHTAYGRMKAQVEAYCANSARCAVFRPTKLSQTDADEMAKAMICAGINSEAGLHRWRPL